MIRPSAAGMGMAEVVCGHRATRPGAREATLLPGVSCGEGLAATPSRCPCRFGRLGETLALS